MNFLGNSKISSNKGFSNKKNDSKKKYSHLYFQDKNLTNIPQFQETEDVLVLYLYNNKITNIENLDGLSNLTSLYLQNNEIEIMENLKHLTNLRKLFIGHNKICVLEGLETLKCLQELHIEKQYLLDNNSLCVDPRTIMCISETLQILNISHNNIISLCHLSPLKNLRVINASNNDLDDIMDICQTIHNWYHLREARFTGNPFTKKRHHYREEIIANSHCLQSLDGKAISDVTRSFIRKFEEEKMLHGSRHSVNIADVYTNLPKNYPPFLQKAVSTSLLKTSMANHLEEDLTTFDEKNGVYIAWKSVPKRKSCLKTPQHLRNKRIHTHKKKVSTCFLQMSNT